MTSPLPDIVIRASAGTGKTYQLTNRYLRLLVSGVPPEGILAATFTRKAAGEILERILLTLARAANADADCVELAAAIGVSELTRSRCVELLAQVTRRLHRLQVGTLDSFFIRLATSYSLELGLPPGWRILDNLEAARLKEDAIESLLESGSDDDLVRLLRLLAKGATTRSVSKLILENVNACHEIAIETTKEAWRRIPCPPLPAGDDMRRSQRLLRDLAKMSDNNKQLQKALHIDSDLAEREQWEDMLKSGPLAKLLFGQTTYCRKELEGEARILYETVLAQTSALALHRLAKQTEATRELLDRFDREYRELQRKHGGCGFSDVARALAGKSERPVLTKGSGNGDADAEERTLSRLTFRMDSRLSHLLLDEFQDTSPLQWHVLRPFAEQMLSKQRRAGRPAQLPLFGKQEPLPSFFCVGDTKQAIYGWRGGDARIFDTLKRHLPGIEEQSLATSFRSAQPIIDAVNLVFSKLSQHPRLEKLADAVCSWCRLFPTHSTAKTKLRGHVQLRVAAEADDGDSKSEATLRQTALWIAELSRQAPGRSIGVLARQNDVVGKLVFQLQSLGIPASEEGGNPLIDSAAVRLVLSLLRLADHPGDTVSRFHLATSPLGAALGYVNFRDESDASHLALRVRRQLLIDGYGPTVSAWVKLLIGSCNRRERSRLEQLTEVAYAYQTSATLRPRDFVQHVRNIKVADPSSDLVRVMTIHQAKGLQFDIVVLPELDGRFPGQPPSIVAGSADPAEPPDAVCLYQHENIRQLLPPELQQIFEQDVERRTHEALCVLYVALTRAIHGLYLLIAPSDSTPTKSYAGLLRASLADSAPAAANAVLFEIGDPHWARSAPATPSTALVPSVPATPMQPPMPPRLRFAPPLPLPERNWQRRAPSQHDAGRTRRLSELLQPRATIARERGTLIHKWFEQIEWLDTGRPTSEELLAAAKTLRPLTIDPTSVLPEFFALLDKPAITVLLRRDRSVSAAGTPRVLREYPFACRFEQTLVSGIIDRLILWQEAGRVVAAELLDFKTDAVSGTGSPLETRIAEYRPQLQSYRRAVAQLFRLEVSRVTARLVFVQPGVVVPVI